MTVGNAYISIPSEGAVNVAVCCGFLSIGVGGRLHWKCGVLGYRNMLRDGHGTRHEEEVLRLHWLVDVRRVPLPIAAPLAFKSPARAADGKSGRAAACWALLVIRTVQSRTSLLEFKSE